MMNSNNEKDNKYDELMNNIKGVLTKYLNGGRNFTGKIVFTLNCKNGGVGNTEAFVQKKIN